MMSMGPTVRAALGIPMDALCYTLLQAYVICIHVCAQEDMSCMHVEVSMCACMIHVYICACAYVCVRHDVHVPYLFGYDRYGRIHYDKVRYYMVSYKIIRYGLIKVRFF